MGKNGYIRHGDIGYRMLENSPELAAKVPATGGSVPLGKDEFGDETFGLALNAEQLGLTPELQERVHANSRRMKAILRCKQLIRRLPWPLNRVAAYGLASVIFSLPAWGSAAGALMELQEVQDRMEGQIRQELAKQLLLSQIRAAIQQKETHDPQD